MLGCTRMLDIAASITAWIVWEIRQILSKIQIKTAKRIYIQHFALPSRSLDCSVPTIFSRFSEPGMLAGSIIVLTATT